MFVRDMETLFVAVVMLLMRKPGFARKAIGHSLVILDTKKKWHLCSNMRSFTF